MKFTIAPATYYDKMIIGYDSGRLNNGNDFQDQDHNMYILSTLNPFLKSWRQEITDEQTRVMRSDTPIFGHRKEEEEMYEYDNGYCLNRET